MAKGDESQQDTGTEKRVYRSKDVHKRRSHKKAPKDKGAHAVMPRPEAVQARPDAVGLVDEGEWSSVEESSSKAPIAVPDADSRQGLPSNDTAKPAPHFESEVDSGFAVGAEYQHESELEGELERTFECESERASEREPEDGPRQSRPSKAKHAMLVVALAIVLVVVGLGAAYAWDRWGRYDDHADMQGEWYVVGTVVPISVGEGAIKLTDDVSYDFEIDDHAKTIEYTFGPMEGQGRYWFSGDRRFLVIVDGEGYNGARTALEDLARSFADLMGDEITGTRLPEGDGVIVLCREPGMLATMAKEAGERAKERVEQQKAKEKEEAERKAAEKEAAEAAAAAKAESETAIEDPVEYYYYDDSFGYVDDDAYDDAYDDAGDLDYVEDYTAGDVADEGE